MYQIALKQLKLSEKDRLLDVGCGSGLFTHLAARTGAEVIGVDLAQGLLDLARLRNPQISFLQEDLETLPFKDNSFDIVAGFNSYQYADSFGKALKEARRVLKAGGRFVIGLWDKSHMSDATNVLKAIGTLLPPPAPGTPGPFALSEDGRMEGEFAVNDLKLIFKTRVSCPFLYSQRCTAASRVAVHRKVYPEFQKLFAERTKALKLGNGLDADTDVGPVVNETQLQTVMKYVEIGKKEGAKLLAGGNRADYGNLSHGWFHEPTIFADADPKMTIAQEEIFGPVVAMIPFSSLDEAVEIANGVKYGLSASIYTRNVNNAYRAMRDLQTGIVYVNAPTIGAEIQLPFGGTKGTGNGHREAGTAAIDFYSEWKTLYVDYSDRLQRAQIDT